MESSLEQWLPVVGFENFYEVSDHGRVRRIGGRVLRPWLTQGYPMVKLCGGRGCGRKDYIHRLMLLSFVGPCPEGMETRHMDGNRTNNILSNLMWGDHDEQCDDKRKHGTLLQGDNHKWSILTEDNVRAIRRDFVRISKYKSNITEMAALYGVSYHTVHAVINREKWTHVT
jgi:hypothetical protein